VLSEAVTWCGQNLAVLDCLKSQKKYLPIYLEMWHILRIIAIAFLTNENFKKMEHREPYQICSKLIKRLAKTCKGGSKKTLFPARDFD
jgi:hypothetical protein